jgi:DNA-binding MarR family transcriptional regulator
MAAARTERDDAGVRWLNAEELSAWRNFSTMQFQLMAELGRALADDGLSYSDYLVLASLGDQPDGRVRPTELGHTLGWEKSRVSHHLSRMQRRGLIAREECPSDQRGWFVVITPLGQETIERAAPGHVAEVRRLFIDLLSPDEVAMLDDVARRVMAALPCNDDSS